MKDVLGVNPLPLQDTIIDMAYSLIEAGLVKKSKKYKVRLQSDNDISRLLRLEIFWFKICKKHTRLTHDQVKFMSPEKLDY